MPNNTGYTPEQIDEMPVLLTLRNNWRQRTVVVHPHPIKPESLITVGVPFQGGEAVICEESRRDWSSNLERAEAGQKYQVYN